MSVPVPAHWLNIGIADAETRSIDELGSALEPLDAHGLQTREQITRLECCHFNALLYIDQIARAIGNPDRSAEPAPVFPSNAVVQRDAATILRAWCAGSPPEELRLEIGGIPGAELVSGLGQRSPLKEWQVQRAIERFEIRSPGEVRANPAYGYVPLLISGTYEAQIGAECPPRYREHADFWDATAQTMIHDTLDGEEAEISLAWAIDLLMPCHWDFLSNLSIVLNAIGGDLRPDRPLALCARNIRRAPILDRLDTICRTLRAYGGEDSEAEAIDPDLRHQLGEPTRVGRWLAASLEKTIREQMGLRRPTTQRPD